MPNKDIIKRRATYRRWWNKHKSERKEYQQILWAAKKANPILQPCTIENCEKIGERHHPDYSKPKEIIWICKFHHRRTEHAGVCSICGERALGRGFCNKHYKSERKKIDPEFARMEKVRRERAR